MCADPNLDHAAELMQLVVSNRPLAMKVAQRAETDVKSKMSVEIAGQDMKARLLLVTTERMKRKVKTTGTNLIQVSCVRRGFNIPCISIMKFNTNFLIMK